MLGRVQLVCSVERGQHVDVQLPALVRLEREVEHDDALLVPPVSGENHGGAQIPRRILDQNPAPRLVVHRRGGRRQRLGVLGIAQREVVQLHGDDVREVRGELVALGEHARRRRLDEPGMAARPLDHRQPQLEISDRHRLLVVRRSAVAARETRVGVRRE